MKGFVWFFAGLSLALTLFLTPPFKEKINMTFVKIFTGLEFFELNEFAEGQKNNFSVPIEAVITNDKGIHTVYKIRGDITNSTQEDIISVTVRSTQNKRTIIQTDNLQIGDRLLINKKLYEKYKKNE